MTMRETLQHPALSSLLISFLFVVFMMLLFTFAHGERYTEKNVTITLYKNEFGWCVFGSDKSPTPVCNHIELKERQYLLDDFLNYLLYGPRLDNDD